MWSIFKRKEFYTAEQVHAEVIAQTLAMIENIKQDMQKLSLPEKAQTEKKLLASLGLHNTKNMKVIRDAEDKIDEHNNIIETNKRVLKIIEEMHAAFGKKAMYLPMNVFTQILDKYHLSVGCLNDYKGTIPEANIAEIAKAKEIVDKIHDNEKVIHYDKPTTVKRHKTETIWDDKITGYRSIHVMVEEPDFEYSWMRDIYPTLARSLESWYRLITVTKEEDKSSYRRFPMIKPTAVSRWSHRVDWETHTLLIAAPVQEMDTLYEISERIITDDPIVFSTVGNGVIIYSMWGDEGNDEVLRKYQELNKFIAENVNLGAITESKEALS